MEIVKIPIKNLKIHEGNAKLHPDWQVAEIAASIRRFGNCDPIGIWKDNTIIEGHGRYMALLRLGYEEADCIRLDHLTDEERRAYMLAHNAINLSTGFDMELLQKELTAINDIDMSIFGLEKHIDEMTEVSEDDYEIPADINIRVKRGEIWEMGEHRLICGDSTDMNVIDSLMRGELADICITDPPYNVDYEGDTKQKLKFENDKMPVKAFLTFLTKAFKNMTAVMKPGTGFYTWIASRAQCICESALLAAGLEVRQQLIWVKSSFVLGRQDYQWQHEPCLYGWKDGAAHYFCTDRSLSTVFEPEDIQSLGQMKKSELIEFCVELQRRLEDKATTVIREDKPLVNDLHPTMKPIKLIARLMANSSVKGDIAFDAFGGAGSTLMAAEQLGRKCRILEINERYASATVDRWEKYTGKRAVKCTSAAK